MITGAASGIGERAARRFAAKGATLVLGDKDADSLARVAASRPRTSPAPSRFWLAQTRTI
nr:SDR family NAD(P)-dependent oxidoreductase [Sphingomonas sp. HMP9]